MPKTFFQVEKQLLMESEVCSELAKKAGIAYEEVCAEEDKHFGARRALERIAYQLSKNRGGPFNNTLLPPEEISGKHLITPYNEIVKLFMYIHRHLPNHQTFLDLGCGAGLPVAFALKLRYDACGIDNSPHVLAMAKEYLKKEGENPDRLVEGDFLTEEFWKTPVLGRLPSEFDLFYFYNYTKIINKAVPRIAEKMKKGSCLITLEWESEGLEEDIKRFSLKRNEKYSQWKLFLEKV